MRVSKADAVAGVLLAVAAAAVLRIKLVRTDYMFGDTAVIFQAMESVLRQGVPLSQIAGAFGFYMPFYGTPVSVLQHDLSRIFANPTTFPPISVFQGHFYFVLYALAPFAAVFSVPRTLLGADVFAFFGLLFLAFIFVRRLSGSAILAGLFVALIVVMPAWWQGLFYGQFYPDRLFLVTGFALAMLAMRPDTVAAGEKSNRNVAYIIVATIACALVDERGALIAGAFLLLHAALFFKMPGMRRLPRVATGIVAFAFGYWLLKYMLPHQAAYSSFLPTSGAQFFAVLQTPTFVSLTPVFLVVNAPLLVLAVFAPRAFVIAALMMMPSIFGTIGGAEKTGWSTHYPSFYFPILIWAAAAGYANVVQFLRRVPFGPAVAAAPLLALIAFAFCTSPNATPVSIAWQNFNSGFYPNVVATVDTYLPRTIYRAVLKQEAADIQSAVPRGALITTVERGMELLHDGRTMAVFPADIDRADYAVVAADKAGGVLHFGGALDYVSPDDTARLDALTLDRMRHDGYAFDKAQFFPAHGIAVVRRDGAFSDRSASRATRS